MMIGLPGPLESTVQLVGAGLFLYVVWRGSLIRTGRYLLPVLLSLLGLLIGALFYIQHWVGGTWILSISSLALASGYGLWFARKLRKTRLDYLKMTHVTAFALFGLSLGLSVRDALPVVKGLLVVSYWGVLLDFVYVTHVRRPHPS